MTSVTVYTKKLISGVASSFLLIGAVEATNVFNLEGFGPISRSMGGAGVAHNIGAAGMMYNPATLGLMPDGRELHVGLDLVGTNIDTINDATGESVSSDGSFSSNRGPTYFAPEIAYTRGDGSLTWGVGAFAQGGLGTEFGSSSFLSRTPGGIDTGLENSSRLLVLRVPGAASWKANDKLTVGGSIDGVWTALNLDLLLGADQIGALLADGRVSGSLVPTLGGAIGTTGAGHFSFTKDDIVGGGVDAFGLAGKLGFTYEVSDRTRIGASYSLETNVGDLEGNATLTAVTPAGAQIPLTGKIKVRDFEMPAQAAIGVSHRVNDKWRFAVDVQRVFWSDVLTNIDAAFTDSSGGILNTLLPTGLDDISIYTAGAEYRKSDKLTIRFGVSHSDRANSSENLFAVIPAQLTTHLTGGASYQLSGGGRIDFALSHALDKDLSNPGLPNAQAGAPITSSHSQINAVIAYVRRFGK